MESKIKYPIYIPSKDRVKHCSTARFFKEDKVDFKIVVEPQEYNEYVELYGKEYVLKLPKNNQGLLYSRLWIQGHSKRAGHKRHWQFDDNIRMIRRLHKGKRIRVDSSIAIPIVEQFTDRYENVGISGFNYTMFVTNQTRKPYTVNCHVYSATLINNEMPYTFRTKHNHDVDICLQCVTNNYCTIAFNALMVDKASTMTVKGGCTTKYVGVANSRLNNSRNLASLWPEYVKVKWKFKRWHFEIKNNWRNFKTPLIRRKDIDWEEIKKESNNFGMKLNKKSEIKSKSLKKLYKEENKPTKL